MAVTGLKQFQDRFNNIPKAVRRAVRAEMEDIADDLVAQMFGEAPQLTGDLAGSIGWSWGDAPAGSLVLGSFGDRRYGTMRIVVFAGGGEATSRLQNRASGTRARDQNRSGEFLTDVALFQEFGTQNMPANPFFFTVYRANKRRIKSRITRAINKAIKTQ